MAAQWLPEAPVRGLAFLVVFLAIMWHAFGYSTFPGDRHGWQAHRERALLTRSGRLYFGMLLGLGVFTRMTTPLVYALILAVATSAPAALAVVAGVGFGFGRSIPAFVGVIANAASRDALALNQWILTRSRFDRMAGIATGSALALLLVVARV